MFLRLKKKGNLTVWYIDNIKKKAVWFTEHVQAMSHACTHSNKQTSRQIGGLCQVEKGARWRRWWWSVRMKQAKPPQWAYVRSSFCAQIYPLNKSLLPGKKN